MQATISGRCAQTISSVISIDSWSAPTVRAMSGRAIPLVGGARHVETGGERQHRLAVQPRHQCENGGAIDAAREKHAVRHVAPLMEMHALFQRGVQTVERRLLVDRTRVPLPAAHRDAGAR